METTIQPNDVETESLLTVCLLAAFADGSKSDVERASIKKIAERLPATATDHAALYQRVLLGQISAAQAVQPLRRKELQQLTYEMAVCICEADNLLTPKEKSFLDQLRHVLQLETGATERFEKDAEALAVQEMPSAVAPQGPEGALTAGEPTPDAEVDRMILNYAILNGALELMPQSLATMAIIPLQMKMVYRIGKKSGYDLDRGHVKELFAAAGVGLGSQVLEGYATKLFGGLFGKIGGKLGRGIASQATASALSFATTYAIGYMAQNYYAGGRKLSSIEIRQLFDRLKEKATGLHGQYAGQIQQRSQSLNASELLTLVRGQ